MSQQELGPVPVADGTAPTSAPGVFAARRRKPPDPVLLERLAETGFLATEFGLHEEAERIFRALAVLKPGKPSPHIALAMVQARRGAMEPAIAALRELLERHPDCELGRAVLGTMLVHVSEREGIELLEDVIARGIDSDAVGVAASCIEDARARLASIAAPPAAAVEFFRHYNVRA